MAVLPSCDADTRKGPTERARDSYSRDTWLSTTKKECHVGVATESSYSKYAKKATGKCRDYPVGRLLIDDDVTSLCRNAI